MDEDPLAAVARLEGVGAAAGHALDAVDVLLRQPAVRRGPGAVRLAAAATERTARADAELEGDDPDDAGGAVRLGSLRVGAELPALVRTWVAAPLQALARVHLLVAHDLVADADRLGRVVRGGERLVELARRATGPTAAPGVVVAAVSHGELAAIAPFGTGDRLVARTVERLVLVARGVDPSAVTAPAAGHLALRSAYDDRLAAYATGTPAGVAAWVRHCCDAYAIGAEVAARALVRDDPAAAG